MGSVMFWFGIGCAIAGLAVGWLLRLPLFVALTSFQTILFVVGLAFAGELSGMEALLWAISGLFCHQAAYLAGAIMRAILQGSAVNSERSVAAEVDEELSTIDHLATRFASQAPQLRPEAATLSYIVSRLRRTLNNQQELEALIVERRTAVPLD
jgi:hypothetical protein